MIRGVVHLLLFLEYTLDHISGIALKRSSFGPNRDEFEKEPSFSREVSMVMEGVNCLHASFLSC